MCLDLKFAEGDAARGPLTFFFHGLGCISPEKGVGKYLSFVGSWSKRLAGSANVSREGKAEEEREGGADEFQQTGGGGADEAEEAIDGDAEVAASAGVERELIAIVGRMHNVVVGDDLLTCTPPPSGVRACGSSDELRAMPCHAAPCTSRSRRVGKW